MIQSIDLVWFLSIISPWRDLIWIHFSISFQFLYGASHGIMNQSNAGVCILHFKPNVMKWNLMISTTKSYLMSYTICVRQTPMNRILNWINFSIKFIRVTWDMSVIYTHEISTLSSAESNWIFSSFLVSSLGVALNQYILRKIKRMTVIRPWLAICISHKFCHGGYKCLLFNGV